MAMAVGPMELRVRDQGTRPQPEGTGETGNRTSHSQTTKNGKSHDSGLSSRETSPLSTLFFIKKRREEALFEGTPERTYLKGIGT